MSWVRSFGYGAVCLHGRAGTREELGTRGRLQAARTAVRLRTRLDLPCVVARRQSRARGIDMGGGFDRAPAPDPRERNPDVRGSAIDRAPLLAQPRGHAATERLHQLRHDAEAAAARANGLPTLVQRDEWRAERTSLTETHATLSTLLEQHAADAAVSAQ